MLKSLLCAGHDRGISFDFTTTPSRDGDSALYIDSLDHLRKLEGTGQELRSDSFQSP